MDIRHKPSADDKLMYEWICTTGLPHIVVATKEDKVKRSQRPARIKEITETLELADYAKIMKFSALKRTGIDILWQEIDRIVFSDEIVET